MTLTRAIPCPLSWVGRTCAFHAFHDNAQSFYLHCELEACVHGIGGKESGNHCQDSLGNQSLLEKI